MNTANPVWYDDEVPVLKACVKDKQALTEMFLLICIWDDDGPIEKPDLCGWAWVRCRPGPFTVKINARGREYGKVMGELCLAYPDKNGVRHRGSQKGDDCSCVIQ